MSSKYVSGLNIEQEVTETLRDYSCVGWNDGQRESWTYPACDAHFHFGGDFRRDWWGRRRDKFGVAFVTYGLSASHMRYPALVLGFALGDATDLNKSWKPTTTFLFLLGLGFLRHSIFSYINNPGYNRARGSVIVPGVRLHIEL